MQSQRLRDSSHVPVMCKQGCYGFQLAPNCLFGLNDDTERRTTESDEACGAVGRVRPFKLGRLRSTTSSFREAVARRESQELWLSPDLIEAVLDYLCANAQEHAISFRWRPFLSDPDDDFILELAVAAKAQYIVTHNLRDFAGVEAFGLEAITPAQMLVKLSETS
jgi:hypothetical protein